MTTETITREKKYIVALDQGTTSSRAVLFDRNANIIDIAQRELPKYTRNRWWNMTRWKSGPHRAQS